MKLLDDNTGNPGNGIGNTLCHANEGGLLLGGSIYTMMPITMALLSRLLKYRESSRASIIAATILTGSFTLTLFVVVPPIYYAFFSVIEIATTALIVGFAWKWRSSEGNFIPTRLAQVESI